MPKLGKKHYSYDTEGIAQYKKDRAMKHKKKGMGKYDKDVIEMAMKMSS